MPEYDEWLSSTPPPGPIIPTASLLGGITAQSKAVANGIINGPHNLPGILRPLLPVLQKWFTHHGHVFAAGAGVSASLLYYYYQHRRNHQREVRIAVWHVLRAIQQDPQLQRMIEEPEALVEAMDREVWLMAGRHIGSKAAEEASRVLKRKLEDGEITSKNKCARTGGEHRRHRHHVPGEYGGEIDNVNGRQGDNAGVEYSGGPEGGPGQDVDTMDIDEDNAGVGTDSSPSGRPRERPSISNDEPASRAALFGRGSLRPQSVISETTHDTHENVSSPNTTIAANGPRRSLGQLLDARRRTSTMRALGSTVTTTPRIDLFTGQPISETNTTPLRRNIFRETMPARQDNRFNNTNDSIISSESPESSTPAQHSSTLVSDTSNSTFLHRHHCFKSQVRPRSTSAPSALVPGKKPNSRGSTPAPDGRPASRVATTVGQKKSSSLLKDSTPRPKTLVSDKTSPEVKPSIAIVSTSMPPKTSATRKTPPKATSGTVKVSSPLRPQTSKTPVAPTTPAGPESSRKGHTGQAKSNQTPSSSSPFSPAATSTPAPPRTTSTSSPGHIFQFDPDEYVSDDDEIEGSILDRAAAGIEPLLPPSAPQTHTPTAPSRPNSATAGLSRGSIRPTPPTASHTQHGLRGTELPMIEEGGSFSSVDTPTVRPWPTTGRPHYKHPITRSSNTPTRNTNNIFNTAQAEHTVHAPQKRPPPRHAFVEDASESSDDELSRTLVGQQPIPQGRVRASSIISENPSETSIPSSGSEDPRTPSEIGKGVRLVRLPPSPSSSSPRSIGRTFRAPSMLSSGSDSSEKRSSQSRRSRSASAGRAFRAPGSATPDELATPPQRPRGTPRRPRETPKRSTVSRQVTATATPVVATRRSSRLAGVDRRNYRE